ncbi:MAG: nitroreductase family protein [Pseudomonadota bacterium]
MKDHEHVPLDDFIEYPPAQMAERAQAYYADLKRRHSIRYFADRPVERRVIEDCLRAAGTAPSGANHQPWHFAVIESAAVKAKVRARAEAEERAFYAGRAGEEWLNALDPLGTDDRKPYLETAPYLIAVFAQRRGGVTSDAQRKNYYINESVGIACGFLIAALHHAGLGTLTHTPKPMNFLNEICGRPDTEKAFVLLVVGHPAQGATVPVHSTIKKPLEEISSWL